MASIKNGFDLSPERLESIKRATDRLYRVAQRTMDKRHSDVWYHALKVLHEHNNPFYARALTYMNHMPVTIDEFIESEDFLGHDPDFKVWPALREDLRNMNPDIFTGKPHIFQTFDGGATGTGKALCLDTPIPTPNGFIRMGDIKTGDKVYDEAGKICNVVKAHPVLKNRLCYKVIFDDGSSIVADNEHLWLTYTATNRAQKTQPKIKTTQEVLDTLLTERGARNHAIPVCGAVEGKDILNRGIDPYTLGAWLGDGSSVDNQLFGKDPEIADEISRFYPIEWKKYKHDKPETCPRFRVTGLAAILRKLNLLKNKHIPEKFLWLPQTDRLALLQGLMDTDGTVCKRQGTCSFSNKNEKLIDGVLQLCLGLGLKAVKRERSIKGCVYFDVNFTPPKGFQVFRLARKQKYADRDFKKESPARWRYIVAVCPVKSRPVRCLTVDSPSRLYLCGKQFIPTHNTHKAHITQMYQLYLLSCFERPVRLWPRLSSNTPLVFVFQSVQERITKRVIYEPFREMFTNLPFVKRNLIWDRDKENVLHLNNNIQVVPALAAINNIVGQGIVSALIDEVNFMSVVEESKQIIGPRGQGGRFDQAQVIYNNLTRRRKSRFITAGPSPGIISVLSSVRYIGDFMDRRLEAINNKRGTPEEEKDVVVIRRAQYEAQPEEDYSGKKFRLLVGAMNYGTRILKEHETAGKDYPENARIELVPVEYLTDFRNDPEGSLRDICGIATDVISPFITQRHKIIAAIMRGTERNLKCWVDSPDIDLSEFAPGEYAMPQIIEDNLPDKEDRKKPRFVHVDLSLTGDRCGIAIVKVAGHISVANKEGLSELLPHYVLEQGITIKPSTTHELDIVEVRKWIVALKEYYGFNIHTVSYDGFQSSESMQMLRRVGIMSVKISVDTTMEPYELLKAAIYQDRFDCQDHEILKLELTGLEHNNRKKKIDHPVRGTKDLADAAAGAVFSASQSRVIRAETMVSTSTGETSERTADGRLKITTRPSSGRRPIRR